MFRPKHDAIYLGDNGRAYCGEHLGMTAQTTGRDLSGQPIYEIRPEDVSADPTLADLIVCEQPRCGRRPLHVVTL